MEVHNHLLAADGSFLPLASGLCTTATPDGILWQDMLAPEQDTLAAHLAPLNLPDAIVEDCLVPRRFPDADGFAGGVLLHMPTRPHWDAPHGSYITLLALKDKLITLHDDHLPVLAKIRHSLTTGDCPSHTDVLGLLLYVLEGIIESNIQCFLGARNRVEEMAQSLDETPFSVTEVDILPVKRLVARLSNQFEDQYYCLAALQNLQTSALPLALRREELRDMAATQTHIVKSASRLEIRMRDMQQYCHFLLQGRTEQRIRMLTILSSICMPLTLIAGVYGMNFKFMPELEWQYGYYAVIGLMGATATGLLLYFQRRGWFR